MKKILFICCLLFSFQLLSSCETSKKRTRKPVTSVKPSLKRAPIFGESVEFYSETKPKGGEIKSVQFLINNLLITESGEENNTIIINSKLLNLGNNILKIVAEKEDGTVGVTNKSIVVYSDKKPVELEYEIVNSYDHDINHFTQGYEIVNGVLYEGTGEYGSSALYKKNLKTQKIEKERALEKEYFGEGITVFGDKLYQLTYKRQIGFVYDVNTFERIKQFSFPYNEGWGLTHNSTHLIMSDGTENLYFINPETLKEEKRIQVYDNLSKVLYLNELEYVDGAIYANVWTTNAILKIDAATGKVLGRMHMNEMIRNAQMLNPNSDVLNGIAYNSTTNSYFITGKLWPKVFEIKIK